LINGWHLFFGKRARIISTVSFSSKVIHSLL
jgi:hypothetical protein